MGVFEMVLGVVLITGVAGLTRTWIKTRAANGGGFSVDQAARLAKLEERIKALESVVSDASYELKQKFKELEK